MRRWTASVLAFACLLGMAGCGHTEPLKANSSENSGLISSASTKPDVWTLDRPPELVVSTTNNVDFVTASCGNYQWSIEMPDGTTGSVEACGAHPLDETGERAALYTAFPPGTLPPLTDGENMPSLFLAFYLDFGEISPETVTVHRWPSAYIGRASEFADDSEEIVDISETFAITPFGDGEFVYEVHAAWGEAGSADYVFNTLPQVREGT